MLNQAEHNEQPLLAGYPDVMTLNQLCEALQIGKDTGYKLLGNNAIKHRRVGRKYIIPKNQVVRFINGTEAN